LNPWSPLQDDGGDANFTVSLIIPDGEGLEASKQAFADIVDNSVL